MVTIIDILAELEKIRMAPLLIPVLKMGDPLAGSLPPGSLKSMIARKETHDDLVNTVERVVPLLPSWIRFAGHLAESKLATGSISLLANVATPIMKPLYPFIAKLSVPLIGPSLKPFNASIPLVDVMIRVSDSFWRAEVSFEKIFRGGKGH
jgi:hypothetical protein